MKEQIERQISTRYIELDGLRGVAVLLVVIWHYFGCTVRTSYRTPAAYLMKLLSFTWSGVDLFFVLSGFLIGGILIDRRGKRVLSRFFVRRAARLLPLYALLLLAFTIGLSSAHVMSLSSGHWMLTGRVPLVYYVTLTQNFAMSASATLGAPGMSPTWSLALEVQMYLFLAIVLTLLPGRIAVRVMLACFCIAPLIRVATVLAFPQGGIASYVILLDRIDAPAAGVVIAFAIRDAAARKLIERNAVRFRVAAGACLFIAVLLNARGQGVGSIGMAILGHSALAVGYAICVAMLVIDKAGCFARIMRSTLLVYCGTISYFVYLFHEPILGMWTALRGYAVPTINSWYDIFWVGAALASTVLTAAISWRFFEAPIVRRAHQW